MIGPSAYIDDACSVLAPDSRLRARGDVHGSFRQDWTEHPSGLLVPEHAVDEPALPDQPPLAMGLFTGCGGMDLGLHMAGFHVIAGSEHWTTAALTYLINLGDPDCVVHFIEPADEKRWRKELARQHREADKAGEEPMGFGSGWLASADAPDMAHWTEDTPDFAKARPEHTNGCEHFWIGDVRKLRGDEVLDTLGLQRGDLDLVCGGPPCQGFSHANGGRSMMDPRNSLVFEFARVVLELNPKAMFMENVPGIVTMTTPEGVPVIDALCRVLEDGGFGSFDALKRSLATSAGAGAALRGRPASGDPDDGDDEPKPDPQMSLLDDRSAA